MLISDLEKIFAALRSNGEAMGDQKSLTLVGNGFDHSGKWWINVGDPNEMSSPVFECKIDEEGQVQISEAENYWSSSEVW